jgi:hypothetical protein
MHTLHDKLVHHLQALNQRDELTYLINALNKSKINSYAEAAILIFLVAYTHPTIMDDPHSELRKLCQLCYLQTTPNQLFLLLNKPANIVEKNLFNQFVEQVVKTAKPLLDRPAASHSVRRK